MTWIKAVSTSHCISFARMQDRCGTKSGELPYELVQHGAGTDSSEAVIGSVVGLYKHSRLIFLSPKVPPGRT